MFLSRNDLYRFEGFVLDPLKRTLVREGRVVGLSSKGFDVLTYLVRNPGRVVEKEELLQAVWPGAFVEEGNLAQHISGLRKALGDRADVIVTIPRQGYQFTAAVERESSTAAVPQAHGGDVIVQTVRERARVVMEEVTPRRDALPMPRRRLTRLRMVGCVLGLAVIAAGAWLVWQRARQPRSGDIRKIVIADFDNRTGDEVFDFVLKNALEIDLEQSPLLTTVSLAETRRTLQAMERSPDERLTAPLAREVCERNEGQAVLSGSVIRLDSRYVILLDATNCITGKRLVALQSDAAGKDGVLDALGDAAVRMRRKLGESLRSVESFDVPIEQSTTPSFDALLAYSHGLHSGDQDDALAYLERAIQIDPNFAMAYESIGVVQGNRHNMDAAKDAFAKAYELHQPVSASEQFIITARYYEIVQEDTELAIRNYVLWLKSYPLKGWVWATLANAYTQVGRYPEAIEAGERSRTVAPDSGFSYIVLARAYKRASRFDEAQAVCNESLRRGLGGWGIHSILLQIAAARHDEAAMQRENVRDAGKPTENQTLDDAAYGEATMGRLHHADELFATSKALSVANGSQDFAVEVDADQAEADRLLGALSQARDHAAAVPIEANETTFQAALNAAFSGDAAYAKRALLEQKTKAPSTSIMARQIRIPLLEAAIALAEDHPAEVPALLKRVQPYALRDYYAFSLLGEAYLRLHQPDAAAAQYNLILANPGIDPLSPMLPLGHLGLARAYAMEGKKPEAREEYETLFALWKNADPDLPVLKQARVDYGRL